MKHSQTLRVFFKKQTPPSLSMRLNHLQVFKKVIEKYEKRIFEALYEDVRKPKSEALMSELAPLYGEIEYAQAHLACWMKPKRVSTPLFYAPAQSSVQFYPRGAVLIISPWNYPFYLTFTPLVSALAAGNCVVLKPSESSPASSQVMREIVSEAFESDRVRVCTGGKEVAHELLEEEWDYIFFTGSSSVGKLVVQAAARHLTPLTLELGGKNPCIVDESADIASAARKIVWGKFFNAGQTCTAPDYVLVNAAVKNDFISAVQDALKHFYGGQPQLSSDYARIINYRHFDRLAHLLSGEKPLIGGMLERDDLYISPTLLDGAGQNQKLMQEEIFGPILPLITYFSLDEALACINDKPHPLALYIFSKTTKTIERIVAVTTSGGVLINDVMLQTALPSLPFGGVGQSGFGRYHGRAGFETFSYSRSIMKRSNTLDLTSLRYPPYEKKFTWIKKIFRIFS